MFKTWYVMIKYNAICPGWLNTSWQTAYHKHLETWGGLNFSSCLWHWRKFLFWFLVLLCKRCFYPYYCSNFLYYTATKKRILNYVSFQYEIKACCLFSKQLMWSQMGLTESYHLHSACSQCIAYFSRFTVHTPYGSIFNQFFSITVLSNSPAQELKYTGQYREDSLPTHKHAHTQDLTKSGSARSRITWSKILTKSWWDAQTWLIQNTLQTIFIQIKKTQVNKVMVHTCYKPG